MSRSTKIGLIISSTLILLGGTGIGLYFGVIAPISNQNNNTVTQFDSCFAETITDSIPSSSSKSRESIRDYLNNQRIDELYESGGNDEICLLGSEEQSKDLYYKFLSVNEKTIGPKRSIDITPEDGGSSVRYEFSTIYYKVGGSVEKAYSNQIQEAFDELNKNTSTIVSQQIMELNESTISRAIDNPQNNYCFAYDSKDSTRKVLLRNIKENENINLRINVLDENIISSNNLPQPLDYRGTKISFLCFSVFGTKKDEENTQVEDNVQIATESQWGLIPGKAKVSIRDFHTISCDPKLREDIDNNYRSTLKEIYCYVLDREGNVSNNFPYFYFDNVASQLVDLKSVGGGLVSKTREEDKELSLILSEGQGRLEKTYYANEVLATKIRENAKFVASTLLDQVSSNNEMILLDEVILGSSGEEEFENNGKYTTSIRNIDGIAIKANIRLAIKKVVYEVDDYNSETLTNTSFKNATSLEVFGPVDIEEWRVNYPPNSEYIEKNLAFDIFSLIETFNHEFGHHQASYTRDFIGSNEREAKLLERLESIFFPEGTDQESDNFKRFEDFKKLVVYLRGREIGEKFVPEDDDLKMLQIIRKYQSKGVRTINDIIYEGQGNSGGLKELITNQNSPFYERLETFLNHIYRGNEINSGIVVPALPKNFRNSLEKVFVIPSTITANEYKLKTYEKQTEQDWDDFIGLLEETHWYDFRFENFTLNAGTSKYPAYTYLPKNFFNTKEVNNDMQKTIGELFNVGTVEITGDKDFFPDPDRISCENAPFFFTGITEPFEAAFLRTKTSNSGDEGIDISDEDINNETMKNFAYYFSTQELFARLSSILSVDYLDNRDYFTGCKIEAIKNGNSARIRTIQNTANQIAYYDYGFFKTFGIDVLALSKEKREELQNFIQRKTFKLENNEGHIQTQKTNSNEDISFFYSNNQVVNLGGISRYLLLDVKLENEKERFKVKLSYSDISNRTGIAPIEFDYGNRFIIDDNKDSHETHDNLGESIEREPLIETSSDAKKYISLVYEINGADLEPYDLNSLTVYIDRNDNNQFDQGDQEIAIKN